MKRLLIIGAFVATAVAAFLSLYEARAAAGDVVIAVNDQFGVPFGDGGNVIVRIACTGGASYEVQDGAVNDGDGVYNYVVVFSAEDIGDGTIADCDNGDAFTVEEIEQNGMVGVNDTSLTAYSTAIQNNATLNLLYGHKVNVVDELGNPITPEFVGQVDGEGTCFTIMDDEVYCGFSVDSDSDDYFLVEKDGYVISGEFDVPVAGDRESQTDPQVVTTMTASNGLKFSHKLTNVRDELGNPIAVDYAYVWPIDLICSSRSGEVYCPIELADDNAGIIEVLPSGYGGMEIEMYGDRTANSDPQSVAAAGEGYELKFAHRIFVNDEFDNDIVPDRVTAGANDTVCVIAGMIAYCPVPVDDDDDLTEGFIIQKDGYVTTEVDLLYDRTDALDTTENSWVYMDAGNGLDFAVKATVTANGDPLSDATVRAGDDYHTACTEDGDTGIYYCPVPVNDTTVTVRAQSDDYKATVGVFTDRTANSDAQQTTAIAMQAFSGGGSHHAPGSESTPTPAPTPTPTPLPTPETPKTITDIIIDEAAMLAARADALDYFKDTGTPSTIKIGSGERNGVLFSFREAYGHDTKTVADWVDALSIANGRWPLTVNKTVEARAYVNFRAVYGRDANMKNSTDVNALKMMGYGVLPAKPRNLAMERSAIARFTAAFGFGPSIARHWNVVRAIAYSGLIF